MRGHLKENLYHLGNYYTVQTRSIHFIGQNWLHFFSIFIFWSKHWHIHNSMRLIILYDLWSSISECVCPRCENDGHSTWRLTNFSLWSRAYIQSLCIPKSDIHVYIQNLRGWPAIIQPFLVPNGMEFVIRFVGVTVSSIRLSWLNFTKLITPPRYMRYGVTYIYIQ